MPQQSRQRGQFNQQQQHEPGTHQRLIQHGVAASLGMTCSLLVPHRSTPCGQQDSSSKKRVDTRKLPNMDEMKCPLLKYGRAPHKRPSAERREQPSLLVGEGGICESFTAVVKCLSTRVRCVQRGERNRARIWTAEVQDDQTCQGQQGRISIISAKSASILAEVRLVCVSECCAVREPKYLAKNRSDMLLVLSAARKIHLVEKTDHPEGREGERKECDSQTFPERYRDPTYTRNS